VDVKAAWWLVSGKGEVDADLVVLCAKISDEEKV
jgi:hypothetical protein